MRRRRRRSSAVADRRTRWCSALLATRGGRGGGGGGGRPRLAARAARRRSPRPTTPLQAAAEAVAETAEVARTGYQEVSDPGERDVQPAHLVRHHLRARARRSPRCCAPGPRVGPVPQPPARAAATSTTSCRASCWRSSPGAAAIVTRDEEPRAQLAIPFGVGMGLTLDESALLLELDDVYWSEEGIVSVQIALAVTALLAAVALAVRFLRRGEQVVLEDEAVPAAQSGPAMEEPKGPFGPGRRDTAPAQTRRTTRSHRGRRSPAGPQSPATGAPPGPPPAAPAPPPGPQSPAPQPATRRSLAPARARDVRPQRRRPPTAARCRPAAGSSRPCRAQPPVTAGCAGQLGLAPGASLIDGLILFVPGGDPVRRDRGRGRRALRRRRRRGRRRAIVGLPALWLLILVVCLACTRRC